MATPSTHDRRQAFILVAASIAIGSFSFTLVKIALRELSPLGLATGRVVTAALFYVAIIAARPSRRTPIRKGDRLRIVLSGLGGSVVFHLLFSWGQQRVTVAMAAVVMATMPAMVAAGEVLFLRHRLTRVHLAGLAAAMIGCAAIGLAGGDHGSTSLLGAGAIALATLTWAAVTVATRSITKSYDGWWLNTPGALLGAVLILGLEAPHLGEFGSLSLKGWLAIIWLGSASSAFIYYVMARVMTVISGTTASALGTVVTPTSVLVAWLVLGDAPSFAEVLGGICVITGAVLVTRGPAPDAHLELTVPL